MAMKTPGVYIVEKNAFPNSIVEVATAVPAFVGYTEKADNKGKSLLKQPWRISSMNEFHEYFGYQPEVGFSIGDADEQSADFRLTTREDGNETVKNYALKQDKGRYLLYFSMRHFFMNGGGPCYVVSVGGYAEDGSIDKDALMAGIDTLVKEQEPTMVVLPDAVLLGNQDTTKKVKDTAGDCIAVQQHALMHCGDVMKNRFAILDIFRGWQDRHDPSGDCVAEFRNALGTNNLDFGAAYYPWVNTGVVSEKDIGFETISNKDKLQELLIAELGLADVAAVAPKGEAPADRARRLEKLERREAVDSLTTVGDTSGEADKGGAKPGGAKKGGAKGGDDMPGIEWTAPVLNKTLSAISPTFRNIAKAAREKLNLLPPSAAMAGIYTMVDNSRGVWKAPANVSMNSVTSPATNITHADQEDLNVSAQGKSINAIRSFIGEGTMIWGARTLDGNSLDWRYINVRRTMIMLEESIRLAAKAYVFEPNDGNTWITIKSMIRNFLNGIWKRGGLAGAVPDDAFSVHVGLGETMTAEDILEGILRVTVLVAVTRPAEFIEITFQQQMQKS